MTTKECIDYFGSVPKLAEALNISRQAVHQWRGDMPPLSKQYELQIKTNNALKVSKETMQHEH